MRYSLLASLVIGASLTLAHPHAADHRDAYKASLNKRSIDLNQYRTGASINYKASSIAKTDSSLKVLKRGDYVETATELVKSVHPDSKFRIADSYIGTNGIGHVYFKQTVHGLDIDNSDFNVNVSCGICANSGSSANTRIDWQGWSRFLLRYQLLHRRAPG
jgi:extracellular elastinolytic metalloproteinase